MTKKEIKYIKNISIDDFRNYYQSIDEYDFDSVLRIIDKLKDDGSITITEKVEMNISFIKVLHIPIFIKFSNLEHFLLFIFDFLESTMPSIENNRLIKIKEINSTRLSIIRNFKIDEIIYKKKSPIIRSYF